MNEIIQNVFVGPISVIYNQKEMDKIDVVVNCTKEKYTCEFPCNKIYYCIPVDDTERPENITLFVEHANKIIDDVIKDHADGKRILIHCSQGVQRSAAFTAFFLVKVLNISLDDAIKLIVAKKPNCFSHGRQVNFMEALVNLL